jgi:aspartyl-tRNA(Asn)/glutamyl-tRNA(Gln) amidotransferase subunit B
MPYPNFIAIKNTILFGLSLGCSINKNSKFDRKHYFYPDLPKGYQISQYDLPFCMNGKWESRMGNVFRIRRIHLEEDTGKLLHQKIDSDVVSLIDFNRSGVPLMELVTEPDFSDSASVVDFLKEIQLLARYLNISNADMEKGSMRLEANISLRKTTDKSTDFELPNYKVELKNINSFKYLKDAIDSEIERQKEIILSGKPVGQETRGYDEKSNTTFLQRSKEEAKDYRYFPEPDIPEIAIDEKLLENIKKDIVETPWSKRKRFAQEYQLNSSFIDTLILSKDRSNYFEKIVSLSKKHNIGIKTIADVMVNKNMDKNYAEPQLLLFELVKMMKKSYSSDEETKGAVKKVLGENPKAIKDYQNGKGEVLGFLIGQAQKILKGQGEFTKIKDELLEQLNR